MECVLYRAVSLEVWWMMGGRCGRGWGKEAGGVRQVERGVVWWRVGGGGVCHDGERCISS